MRRLLCTVTFCCLMALTYGQAVTKPSNIDSTAMAPDISAVYPGGFEAFYKFITKKVASKIDFSKAEYRTSKKVMVKFIIDKSGRAKDFQIVESSKVRQVDHLVLDALRNMPRWKPARTNGRPVEQAFMLPVTIYPPEE